MKARYMLDTNICIYIAKQQPPEVKARFERLKPGQLVMSVITYGELCCGANKSNQRARALAQLDELVQDIPVEDLSSASACTRECKRRAFPDIPATQETLSWSGSDRARIVPVVQTSARLSLKRARFHFTFHSADFRAAACRGVRLTKGYSGDSGAPNNKLRTTPSEQILLSGRSGEGYSALRGWRPIPAALLTPIRPTLFRGLKTIPFTTGQNNP